MLYGVLEGLDYGGKSSVMMELVKLMTHPHQIVREPGGTAFGEQIRSVVLEQQTEATRLSKCEELALMSTQRSYLHRKVIAPALAEGTVVIGDRGEASSFVYQTNHHNDNLYMALHEDMELLTPDVFFLLDLDYQTYLSRKKGRGVEHQFHDVMDKKVFEHRRRRYNDYIDRFMKRGVNAFVIETDKMTPAEIAKLIHAVIMAGVASKA